jgi:O-antigen ligase
LVGLALLPLLVLMTQSRGAFIALLLFGVVAIVVHWGYLRRAIGPWGRVRLGAIAIVVIAAVSFVAPSGVWDRVAGLKHATTTERLEEVDREGSARQRYEIWKVAAKIIRAHLIVGVGTGAYPLAHETYARDEEFNQTAKGQRDAHNTFLTVLAETGILGLIAFIGLILSVVIRAEVIRRRCKPVVPHLALALGLLELGLLSFFTAGIFGSFGDVSFLYIHLGLIWVTSEVMREVSSAAAMDRGYAEARRGTFRDSRAVPDATAARA